MKIRIVTPTFNEEKNIHVLHEKIRTTMSNLNLNYEHVVIDNSSTDNTIKYMRLVLLMITSFCLDLISNHLHKIEKQGFVRLL